VSREVSVGLLFFTVILILGYMVSRLSEHREMAGKGKLYYTMVIDSSGLPLGSTVKVAGINVGRIREKSLVNNRARLLLEITRELSMHEDATITIRSIGYLGDRYVGLDSGSEDAPILREGSFIPAREAATLEDLMTRGAEFLESWTEVARSLRSLLGR